LLTRNRRVLDLLGGLLVAHDDGQDVGLAQNQQILAV
jgi:hypothetical protein